MEQPGGNVLSGRSTCILIFKIYFMPITKIDRARELLEHARTSHNGVYLTGPNQVEVLEDELPASALDGQNYLLASFGELPLCIRCQSNPSV